MARNIVMLLVLMPITLYAADIDLSGINREKVKNRLEAVDAGGSILDGVLEKAVSNVVNSPRISEELSHCLMRCSSENRARESRCNGLSRNGFPGYNGSPHDTCTSKAYSIKTECEVECSRRYN